MEQSERQRKSPQENYEMGFSTVWYPNNCSLGLSVSFQKKTTLKLICFVLISRTCVSFHLSLLSAETRHILGTFWWGTRKPSIKRSFSTFLGDKLHWGTNLLFGEHWYLICSSGRGTSIINGWVTFTSHAVVLQYCRELRKYRLWQPIHYNWKN